ncbi:HD family hydrolase [Vallitalea longa]|uniref:HD family hydrolase n=1 Tax=Vallitalea longa TaxID=2936439 RepID=A0A9W6DFQ1_9FIRM|nr:HD family phosphohydrolase [Vallitalea longa]GKX29702.1 HD family hydrolase [Vallitalea longa]
MKALRSSRHRSQVNLDNILEYKEYISELFKHPNVKLMQSFIQHSDVSTLNHCLSVSYMSFRICKRLKLDCRAGARGGLLHDFYLYDWHETKPNEGKHGFVHPRIALKNANKFFKLNNREQDIIIKHMFPLTPKIPRYAESWVVTLVDKYIAIKEIVNH